MYNQFDSTGEGATARPDENAPQIEGPPAAAAAAGGLALASVAAGVLSVMNDMAELAPWCVGSALGLWMSRTVILLLWRIAVAVEKLK